MSWMWHVKIKFQLRAFKVIILHYLLFRADTFLLQVSFLLSASFLSTYKNTRIRPLENEVAIAVVGTSDPGRYEDIGALSITAQRKIHNGSIALYAHFITGHSYDPPLRHNLSRDDINVISTP